MQHSIYAQTAKVRSQGRFTGHSAAAPSAEPLNQNGPIVVTAADLANYQLPPTDSNSNTINLRDLQNSFDEQKELGIDLYEINRRNSQVSNSCLADTKWHLIELEDNEEFAFVKSQLLARRIRQAEAAVTMQEPSEINAIKFLAMRYEEAENPRVYKNRDKCQLVDMRNKLRYQLNLKLAAVANDCIITALGQRKQNVPKPQELTPIAAQRWAEYCASQKVIVVKAVKYLKRRFNLIAEIDYNTRDVLKIADEKAFEEAIEMQIEKHKGNIPIRMKKGQRAERWNGRDPVDSRGVGIRWVKLKDFSFLRQDMIGYEFCVSQTTTTTTTQEEEGASDEMEEVSS